VSQKWFHKKVHTAHQRAAAKMGGSAGESGGAVNRVTPPYFAWFLIFFVVVIGGPGAPLFWFGVQLAMAAAVASSMYRFVWRGVIAPDRTVASTMTEPRTTEELKSWIFRYTHERLPAAEQPHELYRALYEKHRSIVGGSDSVVHDSRAPLPALSIHHIALVLASGCSVGALAAMTMPPEWTVLRLAPSLADWLDALSMPFWLAMLVLSPRWALRATGAATGTWLAGSAASCEHHDAVSSAPWTSLAAWSLALSFAAELHAPVVAEGVTPLVVRVLGLSLGLSIVPLLTPLLLLISPALGALVAFLRGGTKPERRVPRNRSDGGPSHGSTPAAHRAAPVQQGRRGHRRRLLLLASLFGLHLGLATLALHTHGQLATVVALGAEAGGALRACEWRAAFEATSALAERLLHAARASADWQQRRPPSASQAPVNPREVEQQACAALGLRAGAPMSEIKAAHRKLALEHHPDKTQGRGASKEEVRAAEERFKEIQAAFETLSRLRVRG